MTISAYAQVHSQRDLPTGFFIPFIEPSAGKVRGNPYLEEDWKTGSLTTATGTFDSLLIRYSIDSDVLEYKRGSHTMALKAGAILSFSLGQGAKLREFRYINASMAKNGNIGFYEVIRFPTDRSLFIRHKKNLYKADFGPYSTQRETEYRYEPKLFVESNGKLKKARISNKFCEEHFGLSKEEVEVSLQELDISLHQ